MADYDRDGIPDLVFIKTSNTGTGRVEVHIASGRSNYQTRILETGTTFLPETDGEWHCPECKSTHVMIHEKCQCDVATDSGTVYQVHDEDGVANCWPTYHRNGDKRVFECTRCREQFNIGLYDTTEETEDYYPTRCPTCNCKDLVVKDVKHGDAHPSKIVEWFND